MASRAGERLARLIRGVEQEGWRFVAFIRLVPLFPFNLVNYTFGLTRVGLVEYVIASFVCMAPGAVAYTYLGYDVVFVRDAIMYMTTQADLQAAMRTAFEHCRVGGVALFVPDYVRETFVPQTQHGGHDGDGRSLRYLEWTFDPNPDDTTYLTDYVVMLRERDGEVRVVYDRHLEGLFSRDEWLRLMRETGFASHVITDQWRPDMFIGTRGR